MKGKKLFRWMPALVALCVLFEGLFFMCVTKPGYVPDIWSHVYRVDAILNGDTIARPVTSRSMLHNTENGVVGGAVDRNWMQYSLEQYNGYDPGIVISESVTDDGTSMTVDLPFNNTATNSPVVYAPQLLGFGIGRVFSLNPGMTYYLAEACMLVVYVLLMYCAMRALPRWRIPVGLLLCFPLMVRYSFAISADSLTQAVMILSSCLLFRQIVGGRSRFGAIVLVMVNVVLAMCKFVYVPLVLLAIPTMFDRDAEGHLRTNIGRSVPVIGGVALSGAWTAFWLKINGWYTNCPMMVSYEQMNARKHALLTDPATMIGAVKSIAWAIVRAQANMNNRKDSFIIAACWLAIVFAVAMLVVANVQNAFGKRLGYKDLVGEAADGVEDSCNVLSLPYAWLIVVVCVGDILLIYLALWLQYSVDGTVGVDGMQFRYFLPYAPLFAIVALESGKRLLRHHDSPSRPSK